MKKSLVWLSSATLLSMLLFGCNQNSQRPPLDVIRDGMKKFSDASSYAFVASVDGDFHTPENPDVKDVKITLHSQGAFEAKDPQNLHMNMKLDVSGNADNNKSDGSFELRLQKDMLYFIISKLDTGDQSAQNSLKSYLSKWYSAQIPADTFQQLQDISAKDDSKLTPEQKKVKDLFAKTNFLTNPTFVSTDSVNGENSSHYKADLDKKAVVDFVKQVADIQGKPAAQSDLDQIQAGLDKFQTMALELWVGNTSGILNQVYVTLQSAPVQNSTASNSSGAQDTGSLMIKATLSDFGKPVIVEAPQGAVPFPFLDFFFSAPTAPTSNSGSTSPATLPTTH